MSANTQPPPPLSNPFASRYVRPGAMGFRASTTGRPAIDNIVARLREVRCGVIVGNHGTGKSTLLRELAADLERSMPGGQWVQLTQDPMPPPSIAGSVLRLITQSRETITNIRTVTRLQRSVSPGGVLVIDGAEQLPVRCRWLIANRSRRQGNFCLLTSHHNIFGFETLYRTGLSSELIEELLDELLPPADTATNIALRTHVQHHIASIHLDGVANLRDLWDELYEVVEAYSRT